MPARQPLEDIIPGAPDPDTAAEWDARVEDAVRLGVRFLMRANTMDSLYAQEVLRTNRMGIGPTGLHEYAWMRFGLAFDDLLDEAKAAPFWAMLDHLSEAAKEEGAAYAAELGLRRPVTVTTVKPSGTISKLFGLSEGAHLPARAQYLRWVQFKGTRDPETGAWQPGSDPLLADYEAPRLPAARTAHLPRHHRRRLPHRAADHAARPGGPPGHRAGCVPEQQYRWLRLLERYWIGAEQGNQVSYTLKLYTDRHDLDGFRTIVLREQPEIRCCAILPTRPDHALGYEYLPEEEVPADAFAELVAAIDAAEAREAVDMAHLQCASGVCPI